MASVQRDIGTSQIIVSYPVKETMQAITKAEYQLIHNLDQNKVVAIKFIRTQYNLGLYEAKQIVDTVHSQPRIAD